jgi:hypothetical protein
MDFSPMTDVSPDLLESYANFTRMSCARNRAFIPWDATARKVLKRRCGTAI